MFFRSDSCVIFDYLRVRENFHDLALVIESGDGMISKFLGRDIFEGIAATSLFVSASINN